MSLASKINKFRDQWGSLDKHYKPDGGDSCHRVGMYYALLGMMRDGHSRRSQYPWGSIKQFREMMGLHHVHPGVLIRHPNPDWDASDWDRMSRDQLQPVIIAYGYWCKKGLKDLTLGHLGRLFLFTNNTRKNGANKKNHGRYVQGETRNYGWKLPDLTGPEIWGCFIRAWNVWWLYPLLIVFDIEMFLGSVKWRFFAKHNITMNHTLAVLQAMDRMPTPFSFLARKTMPVNRLIKLLGEHFTDFPNDMKWFKNMFTDAYLDIIKK